MKIHMIPGGVDETPLSVYLRRAYPMCPAGVLKDALKKKDCRVNGVRCGADAIVTGGDEIRLYVQDEYLTGPLEMIHDDGPLLACHKPAGLPVDRDESGVGEDTVLSRLQAMYPGCMLCHRLDAGTSGVLLATRDEETRQQVIAVFRERQVEKRYVCRVLGRPRPEKGDMEDMLLRKGGRTIVDRRGQYASLSYATRFFEDGESVVDVDLHTGRTHQIRVQFARRGYPLMGDDLYGDRMANRDRKCKGIRLHCARMALMGHVFKAPEPDWARKK